MNAELNERIIVLKNKLIKYFFDKKLLSTSLKKAKKKKTIKNDIANPTQGNEK